MKVNPTDQYMGDQIGDKMGVQMDGMMGNKMGESMSNQMDGTMGNQMGGVIESYHNRGGSMEPQGFNDDASCVTGCGGSGSGGKQDNRRELNGMCGNVKTWSNQISAQGLDGEFVGLKSSIGYPL